MRSHAGSRRRRRHLLSFGEFVTYYLLTWSPELWTPEIWPGIAEFDPASIGVPQDWLIRFLYKDEPVDAASRSSGNFTDDYKTLLEHLPVGDEVPSKNAA